MPAPVSAHIAVSRTELDLDLTLKSGQSFGWQQCEDGAWHGVLNGRSISLLQTPSGISIQGHPGSDEPLQPEDRIIADVHSLFRLDVSLHQVQQDLLERDPGLGPLFRRFPGLRVMGQDSVECLLSFVCAVATNIPRIISSIGALKEKYGPEAAGGGRAFPSLEMLADAEPEDLRVGQMEFRCRSLSRAARALRDLGGRRFLESLRELPYEEAVEKLVAIPHVGRKVADCALLFSLGQDSAFPLDTHTWRAVRERYALAEVPATARGYLVTSHDLRERLGTWAGWAQQYIYVESLLRPRTRSREQHEPPITK